MPWTEKTIHPRYKETEKTIQTYVLGAFDSCFRSQFGPAMEDALTAHQLGGMRQVALDAAVSAIKGYIRVCKEYRKVAHNRSRRTKASSPRSKK